MTSQVGVTGHQNLPAAALDYISNGIRAILVAQPRPIVGFCSLASGADQLFAIELLAIGGALHAVVPCEGYEATLSGGDQAVYRRLLAAATYTTCLPYSQPDEYAYDAAGKWIAEHSDLLVAVWDGEEARGLGGTADAVAHARKLGRDVQIVWPAGTVRD
jgi:hypothetical protein